MEAESAGGTDPFLEGARRVGKPTIVEDLAKNGCRTNLLISFAFAPPEAHEPFNDLADPNYLFLRPQLP